MTDYHEFGKRPEEWKQWPVKHAPIEHKHARPLLIEMPDGWPDAVHPETLEHLPATFTGEHERRQGERRQDERRQGRRYARERFPARRFTWLVLATCLGGMAAGGFMLALLRETRVAAPYGAVVVVVAAALGVVMVAAVAALVDFKRSRDR